MPQPQDSVPAPGGVPKPKDPNQEERAEAGRKAEEEALKNALKETTERVAEVVKAGEDAITKGKGVIVELTTEEAKEMLKQRDKDLKELKDEIKEAEKTLTRKVNEAIIIRLLKLVQTGLENYTDEQLRKAGELKFQEIESGIKAAKTKEENAKSAEEKEQAAAERKKFEEEKALLDFLTDILIKGDMMRERAETLFKNYPHAARNPDIWGDLNDAVPGLPQKFELASVVLSPTAESLIFVTGPVISVMLAAAGGEFLLLAGFSAAEIALASAVTKLLGGLVWKYLTGQGIDVPTPTDLIDAAPGSKPVKEVTKAVVDQLIGRLKAFLKGYYIARLRAAAALESDPDRRRYLIEMLSTDDPEKQWAAFARYLKAYMTRVRTREADEKRIRELARRVLDPVMLQRTLFLYGDADPMEEWHIDFIFNWRKRPVRTKEGKLPVNGPPFKDLLENWKGNRATVTEGSLGEILRQWMSVGADALGWAEVDWEKALDAWRKAGSTGDPGWGIGGVGGVLESLRNIDKALRSDELKDALKTLLKVVTKKSPTDAEITDAGIAAAKVGQLVGKALEVLDKELANIAYRLGGFGFTIDQLEALLADTEKYLVVDPTDPRKASWRDDAPEALKKIPPIIAIALLSALKARQLLRYWRDKVWNKELQKILDELAKALEAIKKAEEERAKTKKETGRVDTPGGEEKKTAKAETPMSPGQLGFARVATSQGMVVTTFIVGTPPNTMATTTLAKPGSKTPGATQQPGTTFHTSPSGTGPTGPNTGPKQPAKPPQGPSITNPKPGGPGQQAGDPGNEGSKPGDGASGGAGKHAAGGKDDKVGAKGGGAGAGGVGGGGAPGAPVGPDEPPPRRWLVNGQVPDKSELHGWTLAVEFVAMQFSPLGVEMYSKTSTQLRDHIYNEMKSAAEQGKDLGKAAMSHSSQYGEDGEHERELGEEAVALGKEADKARAEARKYIKGGTVPTSPDGEGQGFYSVMFAEFKSLEAQAAGMEAAAEGYLNAVKAEMEAHPPANPLFADARIKNAEAGVAEAHYAKALAGAWAKYYKDLKAWEKDGGKAEDEPQPPVDENGDPPEGSPLAKDKEAADAARKAADEAIKAAIEAGDTDLLNMYDCSTDRKPPGFPPECTKEVKEICPDDYVCWWYADGAYDPGASKGKYTGGAPGSPFDFGSDGWPRGPTKSTSIARDGEGTGDVVVRSPDLDDASEATQAAADMPADMTGFFGAEQRGRRSSRPYQVTPPDTVASFPG